MDVGHRQPPRGRRRHAHLLLRQLPVPGLGVEVAGQTDERMPVADGQHPARPLRWRRLVRVGIVEGGVGAGRQTRRQGCLRRQHVAARARWSQMPPHRGEGIGDQEQCSRRLPHHHWRQLPYRACRARRACHRPYHCWPICQITHLSRRGQEGQHSYRQSSAGCHSQRQP